MEIGSYIGLDLKDTGEYYGGLANIARLNSARAGICHCCRLYNCNTIYIPYYLCPTVKRFLLEHSVEVRSYFINEDFEPLNIRQEKGEAILLVNYFGIFASNKIKKLANKFHNVIIDNSAAFYSGPLEDCYNVYSPRKFFGVPDGCYVIGDYAEKYVCEYDQDFSSPTASFLFKRIEFSTSETYDERMKNEERIDNSGILKMSLLTKSLLSNVDYLAIKRKRLYNFQYAHELFSGINKLDPTIFVDNECVPMVYPLLIEQVGLDDKLKVNKIYTGRWWKSVLSEVDDSDFEAWLSKYMVPVPIDQRYDQNVIKHIYDVIVKE